MTRGALKYMLRMSTIQSKLNAVCKVVDPIYQPLRSGRIWHKVKFYAEFNRFEFSFSFS